MQECSTVLGSAKGTDDGGFAVADGWRPEGRHGFCCQLRAKQCAMLEEFR
jgi:hypothetical protein